MHLNATGHPLHSRALSVVLTQRDERGLDVHAAIFDLRKRGFVPVGGDLQGAGMVHEMRLRGVVDAAAGVLESIAAEQPHVAFEPSALTGGESCRDPIARVEALAGARLDGDYARQLSAAIGGPRGCSHILTLAHFLGAAVTWALARDAELHGPSPARRVGERVFRRDLVIDGHEAAADRLNVAVQLTDLHCAPSAAVAPPMQRFAAEREVRLLLDVNFPAFTLAAVEAGERWRTRRDLETATWAAPAVASTLVGLPLLQGVTAELHQRLGGGEEQRPLLDAMVMVSPALIQCTAALSEEWPARAGASLSVVGMGGIPDSCYMWRRDGALHRARRPDDPNPGPSRPRR